MTFIHIFKRALKLVQFKKVWQKLSHWTVWPGENRSIWIPTVLLNKNTKLCIDARSLESRGADPGRESYPDVKSVKHEKPRFKDSFLTLKNVREFSTVIWNESIFGFQCRPLQLAYYDGIIKNHCIERIYKKMKQNHCF